MSYREEIEKLLREYDVVENIEDYFCDELLLIKPVFCRPTACYPDYIICNRGTMSHAELDQTFSLLLGTSTIMLSKPQNLLNQKIHNHK